jgi:hypothetical protein
MTALTPALLDTVVEGPHVPRQTLGELLDQRTTLLVFLRHYG